MTVREAERTGFSVLLACHYYPPHIGGIEQVAHAEAKGLAERGHEVTVLTSSPGSVRRARPSDPGVKVVRLRALNVFERFGVPFPVFFLPSLVVRSLTLVRRADVVHVHDTLYLTSWVVAVWCRVLRKPLVVTQHVAVVAHPWRIVALVQLLVYRTLGRYIWRTAASVLVVNSNVSSSLRALGVKADRLSPLPNGVDLVAFAPAAGFDERRRLRRELELPLECPLVLFVGRLVHKKGYRRLVAAAEGQDHWTAVLVGDGDAVVPSKRVLLLGPRDRETLQRIYRTCDLFALPSQGEGFPLTVQEAMASGLPVVTTDDPGYEMYALDRDFVALIPPDSPELDKVIGDLVEDEDRRGVMAAYSRRFAEDNFSWERHLSSLVGTYERAVGEHGDGSPDSNRPRHLSERKASRRSEVGTSGLLRNALWLLGSTAATAAFGLAFWSLAARLYPVAEIGNATSLISAVSLLAYLSLFGLNTSLVRFLPIARRPAREVSAAVTLTGSLGLCFGLVYLLMLPLIAPRTAHEFHGPVAWAIFMVIVIAAAVNLLTDSVFIAYRVAFWNPVVDGLVQGAVKLALIVVLVSAGAVGIFTSYGLGSVAAAACSIWLIRSRLGLRVQLYPSFRPLRRYASFSGANYFSGLLNLAPLLVLPLVALDKLGSRAAGYYYVGFQVANLLGAIAFAVCESLYAEVSHAPSELGRLARRSALIIAVTLVPAAVLVALGSDQVLSLFGRSYADHGATLLRLLCLGALPVAVNTWASFVLRARSQMAWLISSNVVYLLSAACLALVLVHRGLSGIALAWIAANLLSGVVAFLGLAMTPRRLRAMP